MVLAEFDNEAVLDRETQLVWQRNLGIVYGNAVLRTSWETSHNACLNANIGGRMGWRLPSAEELASLIDPALTTLPLLPVGHPFLNVEFSDPEDVYWTNTSYLPSSVFVVCFGTTCKGVVGTRHVYGTPNTRALLRWCVRGGKGQYILR